jgi:hypothetical protein
MLRIRELGAPTAGIGVDHGPDFARVDGRERDAVVLKVIDSDRIRSAGREGLDHDGFEFAQVERPRVFGENRQCILRKTPWSMPPRAAPREGRIRRERGDSLGALA